MAMNPLWDQRLSSQQIELKGLAPLTEINSKIHGTSVNVTVGLEAIEDQRTPSACKRGKYLAICNRSYQAITVALAALKAKSKQTVWE